MPGMRVHTGHFINYGAMKSVYFREKSYRLFCTADKIILCEFIQ
jgi:hypothetical protein